MSKSSLKKELATLSHEQLVQIILDSYDANGEFKEYYEFFLNPDVSKLIDRHDTVISKELMRTKYGYSKYRVTTIKKAVKKFIGFNPGPEAVLDMLFLTLRRLGVTERYTNFSASQMNYVKYLSKQIVKYADDHNAVSETMQRLEGEICNPTFTLYFRKNIKEGIEL